MICTSAFSEKDKEDTKRLAAVRAIVDSSEESSDEWDHQICIYYIVYIYILNKNWTINLYIVLVIFGWPNGGPPVGPALVGHCWANDGFLMGGPPVAHRTFSLWPNGGCQRWPNSLTIVGPTLAHQCHAIWEVGDPYWAIHPTPHYITQAISERNILFNSSYTNLCNHTPIGRFYSYIWISVWEKG